MATNDYALKRPRGMLFDYGGTLVEEVSFNARAGLDWLLARATPIHFLPSGTPSHGLTVAGWSALATLVHESVA